MQTDLDVKLPWVFFYNFLPTYVTVWSLSFLISATIQLTTAYLFTPAVRRDYIGFECERIWDSENFWFSFKYIWDLPPYILDDNVIIGSTLIPKWLDSSPSQRTPVKINDIMASRFVFFPFEQVAIIIIVMGYF